MLRGGGAAAASPAGYPGASRDISFGVNLIDTANVYSAGQSERILGEALKGRRDHVPLATKARMPMGAGPNDAGLSRHHLIAECEAGRASCR